MIFLKKKSIKYFFNRKSIKKNLKINKKVKPMSLKGLKHSFIFIKIRISLKKIRFIKIYKK